VLAEQKIFTTFPYPDSYAPAATATYLTIALPMSPAAGIIGIEWAVREEDMNICL
jgi:hypothetical protein